MTGFGSVQQVQVQVQVCVCVCVCVWCVRVCVCVCVCVCVVCVCVWINAAAIIATGENSAMWSHPCIVRLSLHTSTICVPIT